MAGPNLKPTLETAFHGPSGRPKTMKKSALPSFVLPVPRFGLLLVAGLALLLLTSCGYQFSGQGQGPMPGLTRIAIPVFKNDTEEPNAGAIFAAELRQQFMRKGDMKVVPEDQAQAVFEGTVKRIFIYPVAQNPVSIVSERNTLEDRLYLTVSVRCIDKRTHKVIWQDPNFTYWKVYELSNNVLNPQPLIGFENRENALTYIAGYTARVIHDTFLSNF
ncbi:MAG: LPS assembly lipoprotein LptE [Deltaproteobacteria bacterium]|nr:LPS assembly lipoprotein LptE [Deltaproteobacteria bacterium]MDA8308415.1 LptE family protein [Deltaproteobacteria bacterium]